VVGEGVLFIDFEHRNGQMFSGARRQVPAKMPNYARAKVAFRPSACFISLLTNELARTAMAAN